MEGLVTKITYIIVIYLIVTIIEKDRLGGMSHQVLDLKIVMYTVRTEDPKMATVQLLQWLKQLLHIVSITGDTDVTSV